MYTSSAVLRKNLGLVLDGNRIRSGCYSIVQFQDFLFQGRDLENLSPITLPIIPSKAPRNPKVPPRPGQDKGTAMLKTKMILQHFIIVCLPPPYAMMAEANTTIASGTGTISIYDGFCRVIIIVPRIITELINRNILPRRINRNIAFGFFNVFSLFPVFAILS